MSFVSWAALAIGLLVVAPFVAHLLRRRPPDEEAFAGTDLVPQHAAVADRRASIEDRPLFAVRALSVAALALLGATPLIRCSRLSLARQDGASVALAIVVDDSLSMRAAVANNSDETRFGRAIEGAEELFDGLQPGDAVSIVLAGKPARVALASTSNLDAARSALKRLAVSDRGTDMDGAVKLATGLLQPMAHVDKRIVVLSDLAVPTAQRAGALQTAQGIKLWVPLDELRGPLHDCGVVQADRQAERVVVQLVCSDPSGQSSAAASSAAVISSAPSAGSAGASPPSPSVVGPASPAPASKATRKVQVRAGDEVLAEVALPRRAGRLDVTLRLSEAARDKHTTTQLYATLSAGDDLSDNDAAPVMVAGGDLRVGVVADAAENQVATGGPPPIEQALAALRLGVRVKPLAETPEQAESLAQLALLIVEDPPGFTPAQRRELARWVERGGVLMLALGERSAAAPLGSGFEPLLPAIVRWDPKPPPGMSLDSDRFFGEAAAGFDQLAPKGRAKVELSDPDAVETLSRWQDREPLLIERRLGRGVVYSLTLPLDTRNSDLMLRPGALGMLHRLVDTARSRGGATRTEVGAGWPLDAFDKVEVALHLRDDDTIPQTLDDTGSLRFVPQRIGLYDVQLDEQRTTRVASLDPDEVMAVTLPAPAIEASESMGSQVAAVDISSYVAVLLLALFALELILRLTSRRRAASGVEAGGGGPGGDERTAGDAADSAAA